LQLSIIVVTLITAVAGLVIGAVLGWTAARQAHQGAESRLREAFQALSADALKTNNEAFLDLAETRLTAARAAASADIDARKTAIEHLLEPMAKTLEQVDREIKESERRRVQTGAELIQKIISLDTTGKDLHSQTSRLVDALKRPGVRGRWGELQLKRVIELSGMVEHCDFVEQQTLTARDGVDDRRMRPDVIVRLPGGKRVVIDAKAPLDAYLKALDAPDEATRQTLLADHAKQVRVHLTQLAGKGYAAHVQPGPDFVVMFLPGEMFFSAALEQDPSLIEFGVEQRVVPASPTTLIALLRAVAYGWQQQANTENAQKISELGRNLYDSIAKLAEHFDAVGGKLQASLEAYNRAVGSLEGNVLIKARRFKDLQVANGDEIPQLTPIDKAPRMLQAPELIDGLPFHDGELAEPEKEEVERV
jgi:DNA recombination protein RmuC